MHVRLAYFDIEELGSGIDLYDTIIRILAYDLLVHLTLGRDVNDDVVLDLCLTAEAATLLQATLVLVSLFYGVPFRQRTFFRDHTVFREIAIGRGYLTA